MKITMENCNEQDVEALAKYFACYLKNDNLIVTLDGEVGAGKTRFGSYFATYFGYSSVFSSPTYSIMNIYDGELKVIYHFDLYRADESDYEWIFEYFDSENALKLVEWSSMHKELFEGYEMLSLFFEVVDEDHRNLVIGCDSLGLFERIKGGFGNDFIVHKECNISFGN
ncbi:tRNA (adenosine(37)-N6)-threonylcarbamoyltransferase complex ATPase subunit type 1 TsaE [Erysipelotrichaceae bacterium]|nr:tRNA (adenosine(37)-N6)-threonylcarbamoyltransferase complex ATPase subunit type 1 TsaE [Erysipelotrichaceae bacterium]